METLLGLLVILLWMTMAGVVIVQYAPACKDLKGMDAMVVFLIFLIGGPIFSMASVLEAFLTVLLPEGWDDENDDFKGC